MSTCGSLHTIPIGWTLACSQLPDHPGDCPKRANNRAWKQQITLARIEDLAFMAETGETREGAAMRLGVTLKSLDKWAREHAPETWAEMPVEPPGHIKTARVGRWAA